MTHRIIQHHEVGFVDPGQWNLAEEPPNGSIPLAHPAHTGSLEGFAKAARYSRTLFSFLFGLYSGCLRDLFPHLPGQLCLGSRPFVVTKRGHVRVENVLPSPFVQCPVCKFCQVSVVPGCLASPRI